MRGLLFNEIYRIVKLLNVTILTKLLEAHARKPPTPIRKDTNTSERMLSKMHGQTIFNARRPLLKKGGVSMTGISGMSLGGPPGKVLKVTTPGSRLPPGVKTKTVLARVQSQPMRNPGVIQKRFVS